MKKEYLEVIEPWLYLNQSIDGFSFKLIDSTDELESLAIKMKNAAHCYGDKILKGKYLIGIMENEKGDSVEQTFSNFGLRIEEGKLFADVFLGYMNINVKEECIGPFQKYLINNKIGIVPNGRLYMFLKLNKSYNEKIKTMNTQEIQTKNKFTFFWGGPFSQWCPSPFTIDGIEFTDAEMYMMYKKALLFNDTETAEKILQANHPSISKKLGRTVSGFDKSIWEANCKQFVYDGNYAKFTQNPNLLKSLMDTGDTELVEASPEDKIWGIGLAEDNPLAWDKKTWQGTNWLGQILTQLRTDLIKLKQKPTITFEDFLKVDIRVCKILSVEKVEKADKLYKLEIDTGFDKRTVVSAIAHQIEMIQLIGQFLPFVLNLEPRKIRGIESTAMIILGETLKSEKLFRLVSTQNFEEEELTGAIVI